MSSTRSRNKYCLSLDNSSSHTSSTTLHLNRWSEVVPPKTALTFAALWDPDEGMVTFSGAALLESENLSGIPPHPDFFDDDGHSQFISLDSDGIVTSENTATLSTFQDAFKAFLHRTPWDSIEYLNAKAGQGASCCLQTRASSTFDGLDVYSHDIPIKPKRSLQLSCIDLLDVESSFRTPSTFGRLRLRSDLMHDSHRPESEAKEAHSGSRLPNLRSHFSTTTTSTSNHVNVTANTPQTRISEPPPISDWQKDECVSPAGSWPSLTHRRRLLRKRRPESHTNSSATSSAPSTPRRLSRKPSIFRSPSSATSASSSSRALTRGEELRGRFPRPVGAPSITTTSPPTSPSTPPKSPRLKLRFTLLPRRKSRQTSPESDGWVFIEVTPIIRQRYMADLDDD